MKQEEVKKNPIPPRHDVIMSGSDMIEFRRLEQICKDVMASKVHYTGVEEYLWEEIKRNCDRFIEYINNIREDDYISNINNEYKRAFLSRLQGYTTNVIRRIVGSFVMDEVRRGSPQPSQPGRREALAPKNR